MNMKIDWKRKLTSRKFWTAIAGFVAMMITAFGGAEETATQITALIMAGAAVVAYIIGEGLADAANAGKTDEEAPENGSTVKVTKEGIELNSPRVTLATAVVKQPEE